MLIGMIIRLELLAASQDRVIQDSASLRSQGTAYGHPASPFAASFLPLARVARAEGV